jgi:hypothetical protein
LLVCVLFARPLVTLGCVLHAPKAGNVPAHEIAIVADDGDDDDDSLEGIFGDDPLVTARVSAIAAPDVRAPLARNGSVRIPPRPSDPAEHPPRPA